jgi:transcriptional regulator with XRE-family HTH domain
VDKRKRKAQLVKFGNRLSEIRKKKGLSFRELAAQCNVDYSDIAKYENGEKNLTILTILELASGLGIHPRELFDYEFDF